MSSLPSLSPEVTQTASEEIKRLKARLAEALKQIEILSRYDAVFRGGVETLVALNYFFAHDELHIILKRGNLETGEHSIF